MNLSIRFLAFSITFSLLVVASVAIPQEVPKQKGPPPSRLASEIERLRALEPGERLKHVEKLAGDKDPFVAVKSGDLVTAIVERGTVEAANVSNLVCKVKAKKEGAAAATVKWLVDDGTLVKKGDRLVQLDDAALRDDLKAATVKLQEAQAAFNLASQTLKLAEQETVVGVSLAEVAVKLTELELKDPPAGQKKEVLQLKLDQAKLKMELARIRARAAQLQAEAVLQTQKASVELATAKLRGVQEELQHCVLHAPTDGLVVYPHSSSSRFGSSVTSIGVGEKVREGQTLLRVSELKEMIVATRVHEAVVSTVRSGQATRVRVDAFPNRLSSGKVSQVSSVAAQVEWQRNDVKVYPVSIAIEDGGPDLKPGMSAEIQIETGTRKGVLQVPLKSIAVVGKDRICFVKVGQELVERKVSVGGSNASSVEIGNGLKEKDVVLGDLTMLLAK
jgi:multidrug efflux pump subunit AcrA (membrane-fusion protein)